MAAFGSSFGGGFPFGADDPLVAVEATDLGESGAASGFVRNVNGNWGSKTVFLYGGFFTDWYN